MPDLSEREKKRKDLQDFKGSKKKEPEGLEKLVIVIMDYQKADAI